MRYFIELAYQGKNYCGWQMQPNVLTVQELMDKKLSAILKQPIYLVGAGRTDSGVHAKQMFAHFDYDGKFHPEFLFQFNSFLPKDIAVRGIHKVKSDAHARFDALERTYEYYISPNKNPFAYEASWILYKPLNLDKMNQAAQILIQTDDFGSFMKSNSGNKTNICELRQAYWKMEDNQLVFTITSNRFLRDMVRSIVGTLVNVGLEKTSLDDFRAIIDKKERKFAGASAPAQGLYLAQIKYPAETFIL